MELAVAACKSITGAGLEVPPAGDALDEIHAARQAFEEADTRLEEVRADTVRLVCQRLSRIVLAILTVGVVGRVYYFLKVLLAEGEDVL